jgi:hypothetical protein
MRKVPFQHRSAMWSYEWPEKDAATQGMAYKGGELQDKVSMDSPRKKIKKNKKAKKREAAEKAAKAAQNRTEQTEQSEESGNEGEAEKSDKGVKFF